MSTGLEIAIEKGQEDGERVEYAFHVRPGRGGLVVSSPSGRAGRAVIVKMTGEVAELEACPDDISNGVLFARVVAVLKRHWKQGEYPDVTWWAG